MHTPTNHRCAYGCDDHARMLATLSLAQAVALPPEISRLQQLRELRVEYAQLDSVPPAVQVRVCCAAGAAGCRDWVRGLAAPAQGP